MTAQEDLEQIQQAAKTIEEMEIKYADKLVAFANDVRVRHPAAPYNRHLFFIPFLARSNYGYTLDPAQCTDEFIVFCDDDGDSYYLPLLWLEDPEAWHADAVKKQADYQDKEKDRMIRTRELQIADLQAELAALQ